MTNPEDTLARSHACIDYALDAGFFPKDKRARGWFSGSVYKYDKKTVSLFVGDREACEFKVVVYAPVWIDGSTQCGPKLYSVELTNLPVVVFQRQLESLLNEVADSR